ncbi:MAG: TolC family protein [Acidobacteria bacterium]|nr:TolC family protein [Acidobacteriota bacterium]
MRSLISLLLLASAPLAAQQVARFITWPEVERRALDSPAAVKLAQANAGASRAAALGTRVARYPAIQANFSSVAAPDDGTRLGTGTGSLTNPIIFPRTAYGVTISQLITDFGRSSHLTQAAVQRSFADQQTAKQAELQVRLLARQAYLAVWRAQALERLARRQLDQVRAAGRPLAESELQLTLARNECMTAAIDLSSLIGEHDLAAPYEVPELLDTRPVTTDIGELMAAALRQNPEVEQRRRILKAAEEQVRAERAGRWPVVTGLATLGYAPLHSARFGRSDFTVVGLTIGLPMPLTAAHRAPPWWA